MKGRGDAPSVTVGGDAAEDRELLRRASAGDRGAFGELLERHHDRLARMVALRLDPRLRGRLDPGDVLQEVFGEATRRLPEYLAGRRLPFFLWLRLLAGQTLAGLHRHHLGVHARDARREERRRVGLGPEANSQNLADRFVGDATTPGGAAIRGERRARVTAALDALEPLDREVLALRHFEGLGNVEAGTVLGITPAAATKRYFRALKRLRGVLEGMGAGPSDCAS
jgi:RNA polymerase sigma-70 factor (ECF subfamily)